MKLKSIYKIGVATLFLAPLAEVVTSCTDPSSNLVAFTEDHTISTPNDTVFSLIGIINKMQKIADRTIVLGEMRGDLTSLTADAPLELQDVANFTMDSTNPYNNVRDYYAVIQNCNYFLDRADTTLTKRGMKVFEKEYAVIKTYRAWTYLQLAINYGAVPFYTKPILTEKEADPALYPMYDINQIADYFIKDLAPYVDTDYPAYGNVGGTNSMLFYYPVRVMLGDLCLWSGRYAEAAKYYHDYLTKQNDSHILGSNSISWSSHDFKSIDDSYSTLFANATRAGGSTLTVIPMESDEYDGTVSLLSDIFNSTVDNNYYYQATHSAAYDSLSQSQRFTLVYTDPVTQLQDTVTTPDTLSYVAQLRGDLRQFSVYSLNNEPSKSSALSSLRQTVRKYSSDNVCILRLQHVYLRYAEALNRAGYPNSAFAVLKYGLNKYNIDKYIPEDERTSAGNLIQFSEYTFTRVNTIGIHSRGCGNADADTTYVIPEGISKNEAILYVEDRICDEMALETAAEGLRFYDLMRISFHRNAPEFLANKVALRDGTLNESLFSKLSDQNNWYLTLE